MNKPTRYTGDEALVILADDNLATTQTSPRAWRVLIVDDDPQVHTATEFALTGELILGRPLELLHATSAAQARQLLFAEEDIAVVFLDVVMESAHTGLELVRVIREELGLTAIRIILRTGQPGYAPELEVINNYDVNDYRTKAELTRTRLLTSLTTAIRSYDQLRTIAYSRWGLEKIVEASAQLFNKHAMEGLAEGVLMQIARLLGLPPSGVVCAQRGFPLDGSDSGRLYVVAAVGRFAGSINRPLSAIAELRIEQAIVTCMQQQKNIFTPEYSVLYLNTGTERREVALFLDSPKPLDLLDRQLLEVFAANISVGFSNVYLFHRLNFLAYHAPLTTLPNRAGLVAHIDKLRARTDAPHTVMLMDIDQFADINDTLGSRIGDAVIRAVSGRLHEALGGQAHLGRYGGDVLCVIAPPQTHTSADLIELFVTPITVNEYHLPISVTVGECLTSTGSDGLEVLNNAGLALTRAKRAARGHAMAYTGEMAEASRQRLDLLQTLRQAIANDEIRLFYQPKIDLNTGRVVGAEALLRWQRSDGVRIGPDTFIPLAEQSGLILDIGHWVTLKACRQLAAWSDAGYGHLHLAINLAAPQLRRGECVHIIRNALDAHSLDPARLEVEITESMLLDDVHRAAEHLEALRELGVRIALDDFGTGFSSLSIFAGTTYPHHQDRPLLHHTDRQIRTQRTHCRVDRRDEQTAQAEFGGRRRGNPGPGRYRQALGLQYRPGLSLCAGPARR